MEVMVGEVGHHLGSLGLVQTFVQVIGTALPETAVLTTLLTAQVASNVAFTRMILLEDLTLTFLALEVLAVAAILLDGNLEIGSVPGNWASKIFLAFGVFGW